MGRFLYRMLLAWWLLLISLCALFWPIAAIGALMHGNLGGAALSAAVAAFVLLVPFRLTMQDRPWKNW
ncbi:MAG: hypothetical protein ABS75_07255 [Pelagibacterium sp. SCN 63-23]|nr:MAG: hypothetical protein ABS75_07255 [Pelagibacterium sp. SCN 63-23]